MVLLSACKHALAVVAVVPRDIPAAVKSKLTGVPRANPADAHAVFMRIVFHYPLDFLLSIASTGFFLDLSLFSQFFRLLLYDS